MFTKMFTGFSLTSVSLFAIMLLKFKWVMLVAGSAWSVAAAVLGGVALVELVWKYWKNRESSQELDSGILNGLGINNKS